MKCLYSIKILYLPILSLFLVGCLSSIPMLGGGSGNTATGGAAGSASSNTNSQLERCDKTLGTLTIFEDTSLPWWNNYRRYHPNLGSTIPIMRMMIQQSNCFVIVERGGSMKAMRREHQLMQAGDLRGNSNIGRGQMVAADYTLSPSITFEQSNMGKIAGAASRFLPSSLFGGGSVGAKSNEASTTLLMIDNRSGVQVSSSIGSAKNYDFSIAGFSVNGRGWGSVQGYAKTAAGKVIIAAFADSYNQMVKALRNYKPQVVKGGLGAGGALKVDGAVNAVSEPKPRFKPVSKPKPQPQSKSKMRPQNTLKVSSRGSLNVRGGGSKNVYIDEYDARALNNYYKALKGAVENLSRFAGIGVSQMQTIGRQNMSGVNLWAFMWGSFSGDLETSKIELESWPLNARKEGWKILGKRIVKYNKLFYKHRKTILTGKDVPQDVKTNLNNIELVTKKSLFEEL